MTGMTTTTKARAAQVEASKKAAALAEANKSKQAKAWLGKLPGDRDSGDDEPPLRLLTRTEVLELLHVSNASLWGWIQRGLFPPGIALAPGARGRIVWIAGEVEEWVRSRPRRMPKSSKAA
jgi:predicted DNA-binding transcriptional regulator AlpA